MSAAPVSSSQHGPPSMTSAGLDPFLRSCTLLPALDLDPRPTFILDLDSEEHGDLLPISYANPALRSSPNLYEALRKTVQYGSPLDLAQPGIPIMSYGREWEHYSLQGRWRVVSAPRCADLDFRSCSLPLPQSKPEAEDSGSDRPISSKTGKGSVDERSLLNTLASQTRSSKFTRYSEGDPDNGDIVGVAIATTTTFSPLTSSNLPSEPARFLALFNWQAISCGSLSSWPGKLQETFLMILLDPRPACLFWGPDCLLFYNEAYIPVLGDNHPKVMGLPIQQAFPDFYEEVNKPLFDQICTTRQPFVYKNLPVTYARDGEFLEERYIDWTSMPVLGSDMQVIGAHQSLLDSTQSCREQRRTQTVHGISAIVIQSYQLDNIWDRILERLSSNPIDLPQALVYSLSSGEEDPARLCGKLEGNISCKPSIELENFELQDQDHRLARLCRHAISTKLPLYLTRRKTFTRSDLWLKVGADDPAHALSESLPGLLNDSTSADSCESIIVLPITLTHSEQTRGFLIIGLHPRQPYDEAYQSFMMLIQQSISAIVTSALLWREGRLRSTEEQEERADLSSQLLRQMQETKLIEARFSQLARHAPIGICIYRADGAMAFANKMWYSLTDFSEEADNSSPGWWAPMVYPDDLGLAFSSFSQLQLDMKPVHFEIRLAAPSKQYPSSITWVLVSAYPELRENGELDSIVACFTDITEQKWAAEVERRRTEDALEAKRQQENFIDVTSHEIRNPLSVSLQCAQEINNIAKTRIRDAVPKSATVSILISDLEDIFNAAQVIEQCTMHQKRIVDDILTLSKIDGGMLPFNVSPAQPLVVAENILRLFSREFVYSGIEITFQVDPSFVALASESCWLELDPGRLSQMLINLMTNAIKFTKTQNERSIELRLGASSRLQAPKTWDLEFLPFLDNDATRIGSDWDDKDSIYLHFLVSDSGSGISDEDEASIFARFSQGAAKDYTQYGGSGLGLYICRALVETHGGQIGFRSMTGVGSTFGFCIKTKRSSQSDAVQPLQGQVPQNHTQEDNLELTIPTPNPDRSKKLHFLIVEDNLINQKVLSKQLRNAGHFCQIANHGKECLDLLADSRFCKSGGSDLSVVLMDIEMPVMNGIDCTRAIRQMEVDGVIKGHVPIISTTGNARNEKVQLIKDAGVDDVILKPYSIPDLLRLVGVVLKEPEIPDLSEMQM